jgi:hypothetical protein
LEPCGPIVAVQQREITSCKSMQSAAQPIPPCSSYPQPTGLVGFHSSSKLIKINYNSPTRTPHRRPSPTSYNNDLNRTLKCAEEKEEADRSESTKIVSKVQAN